MVKVRGIFRKSQKQSLTSNNNTGGSSSNQGRGNGGASDGIATLGGRNNNNDDNDGTEAEDEEKLKSSAGGRNNVDATKDDDDDDNDDEEEEEEDRQNARLMFPGLDSPRKQRERNTIPSSGASLVSADRPSYKAHDKNASMASDVTDNSVSESESDMFVSTTTQAAVYNPSSLDMPVQHTNHNNNTDHDDDDDDDDDDADHRHTNHTNNNNNNNAENKKEMSKKKSKLIEESAGTHRLNRILSKTAREEQAAQWRSAAAEGDGGGGGHKGNNQNGAWGGGNAPRVERVHDVRNLNEVARFAARVVLPPLKVDPTSIGGAMLDAYPVQQMQQEALACFSCRAFESTAAGSSEMVTHAALEYPSEFTRHKRRLGLMSGPGGGASSKAGRQKYRYVIIARSSTRPLLSALASGVMSPPTVAATESLFAKSNKSSAKNRKSNEDDMDRGDYDTMFEKEDLSESLDLIMRDENALENKVARDSAAAAKKAAEEEKNKANDASEHEEKKEEVDDDEVASFPVLMCMTLHSDGSAPDVRKLIPLDQLTTVQDLHATVVQLAFRNGDMLRLDFGEVEQQTRPQRGHPSSINSAAVASSSAGGPVVPKPQDEKARAEGALDKERFIWTLMQVHAMLCISVVERNSHMAAHSSKSNQANAVHRYLAPLNVRNLDRSELQYVATVNGFLSKSPSLCELLDRQRYFMEDADVRAAVKPDASNQVSGDATVMTSSAEDLMEKEEMDNLAYSVMMGNFNTRVSLFHSEGERKDAEEVLNSTEWRTSATQLGASWKASFRQPNQQDGGASAASVVGQLGTMLQWRMRDLEAETCRRLIAWEDEKHYSATGAAKLMTQSDERDTVDALALATLFKTLDSLDGDLALMEEWLQDRAAAIKPLTDDCADIEEENRQLEQQWKSYDMLGSEMKRLLQGLEINEDTKKILQNPASVLVYDEDGNVDIDASEVGVEQIYEAGKALQDAIEYPRESGGLHLQAVNERLEGLTSITKTYCTALAQIIVTVMEQFKTEVVAGSDYGKVSKNDTHAMIAKKIRDTQRKFQSALLQYIKLIEILSALAPEMLPALRDAYAEMVSEGILMKKRCKGYFQALPGKNSAYMNRIWKDIKDYIPFDDSYKQETVNAPDIRAALSELLPVIAREAYFTSALFGPANKEQDGREKKRNFENTRAAVDSASIHFRYYIYRTCGIHDEGSGKASGEIVLKSDPLLNLVSSIYLNEAMDNYIDREKKGGDHSLSLAYVRATILDLRKKADKQWVLWVEKQMEWIRSHDGVPLNGKKAGIFPSFARFPCYIDHVMSACSEGRDEDYKPEISSIKVINYYMQKMAATLLESLKDCAARETTDQQYASNVMQMENAFFFSQAIKARGPHIADLFSKQAAKANAICKDSTDSYLGWMIKREFATLHELFSKVSKIRKEYGDKEVTAHVPKAYYVKTLTKECGREVLKERVTAVYSRMGKHLSDEGGLLPVAWKALVKVLYEWFGRWEKLSTTIYQHKLDPGAVDVVRIAKAAGGSSKNRSSLQGNEFGFKSILALGGKDK